MAKEVEQTQWETIHITIVNCSEARNRRRELFFLGGQSFIKY